MYDDFLTRIPADEDDMWDILWEQFELHILRMLWHSPVETREDALRNKYHQEADGRIRRDGMHVIRYRNENGEIGQRDYFLKMGRELLPYVHQTLDERKLTPEFVQQWGKIMFCHGYIASYVFDDTDDLFGERNRRKGALVSDRTPQRVFLARLLLWFMDEQKQTRQRAEASAAKAIWDFIDTGAIERTPNGPDIDWFRPLVRECKDRDLIVSTMNQKNMKIAALRELAATEIEGVPAIALVVPAARS